MFGLQVADGDERSPAMEALSRLITTNHALTSVMYCGNEISGVGCKLLAKVLHPLGPTVTITSSRARPSRCPCLPVQLEQAHTTRTTT